MKGWIKMTRNLSYGDQMDIIASILKNEIQKLDSLSPEEAQKEAHRGLMKVGIIDENGNYTAPYAAVRDEYV